VVHGAALERQDVPFERGAGLGAGNYVKEMRYKASQMAWIRVKPGQRSKSASKLWDGGL
jgi:hypothetical protein